VALNNYNRSNQQKKEELSEQNNESFQEEIERYNKSLRKSEKDNKIFDDPNEYQLKGQIKTLNEKFGTIKACLTDSESKNQELHDLNLKLTS